MLTLYFVILQNYYFHNLLGNLLEFSMYIFKWSENKDRCISFFLTYILFISLFSAFALVRSSYKIVKGRIFLPHS